MSIKTWKATANTAEDALELPQGRLAADFGFLVEQDVNPDNVLTAATSLVEAKLDGIFATQAALVVSAQKNDLCFSDWAEMKAL